jgi:hypothetical protein
VEIEGGRGNAKADSDGGHGNAGELRGRDNVRTNLQGFITALPDIELTNEDIPDEGNRCI